MYKYYYSLKPFIPRPVQILLRRQLCKAKLSKCKDIWPIDPATATPPKNWQGWPQGKQFALLLQHDVDTQKGHDHCWQLAQLERDMGFRSSFNFVPERYTVSPDLRSCLVRNGFEIGVHGLKHDGKLFRSKRMFLSRAPQINRYLQSWNCKGFSSPSMHHNLEWMHHLDIEYATSTFDTDPFEPQSDSVQSIFPLWVQNGNKAQGYLELPYTLAQDHTLFVVLRESNADIWKTKLDWIAAQGGMALLNTHPDYMSFDNTKLQSEEYPAKHYADFLEYVRKQYAHQYWHATSNQLAAFWQKNVVYNPYVGAPVKPCLRQRPNAQHLTAVPGTLNLFGPE